MLAGAQHLVTVGMDAAHAGLRAVQEPGVLDRIGAAAIGLLVLACWLFTPSTRGPR